MLDVPCYCTKSRRLSRSLTEIYDRALEPTGLTIAQFSLLRMVTRLGAPTISEVAEATGLDRTTLGRNLAVMQRSGWIALSRGEDGRTRVASTTEDGRAVLGQAVPIWGRTQAAVEERLPPHLLAALEEASQLLTT